MTTPYDTVNDLISDLEVQLGKTDALIDDLKAALTAYETGGGAVPAPGGFTVTGGTEFVDGASGPKSLDETAATAARFEIVGSLDALEGTQCLAACTNEMRVAVFGDGRIEMEMSNYGPNPRSADGIVKAGTTYRIIAVQDRKNDIAYIELGPVGGPLTRVAEQRGTIGFASNDTFRGNQSVMFLRAPGRNADRVKGGTFSSLKVWLDDAAGAGAPDKVIAGDAATVNADPWHGGAAAT